MPKGYSMFPIFPHDAQIQKNNSKMKIRHPSTPKTVLKQYFLSNLCRETDVIHN